MNSATIKKILPNLWLAAVYLLAGIIIVALATRTDARLLIADLWQTQFLPTKNTAVFQTASTANPLWVYYAAIAVLLVLLRSTRGGKAQPADLRTVMMIIVTVLISSQTLSHVRYFRSQLEKFYHKDLAAKIGYNFAKSYQFAQYCRGQLPGNHFCRPITDADLSPQKNLLTYLAIRYYLYPLNIVTRPADNTFDCLIIFLKDHPQASVPPDFRPCPAFDAGSLIAVREGIRP